VAAVGKGLPTEIRIYYEGDKALAPGFAQFFSPAERHGQGTPLQIQSDLGEIGIGGVPGFCNRLENPQKRLEYSSERQRSPRPRKTVIFPLRGTGLGQISLGFDLLDGANDGILASRG